MNERKNEEEKAKYLLDLESRFSGEAKELLKKQIYLFYKKHHIPKTKYHRGEMVKLKKGTFLHGILGELLDFDFVVDHGFLSTDFTKSARENKIKNSVGMWKIREDCLLKDYIYTYSGFTITYTLGRGPGSEKVSVLIPYHQFDAFTEKLNNENEVWMYFGEQTKEVRFLPSLVSEKRQIAFILNMDSDDAMKLGKLDLWNLEVEEETLKCFLDERYLKIFLEERNHRNASTTDRESAILFGLPSSLIEGILVGRKIEHDLECLDYIKSRLPDCYICNLDGRVVIGNKEEYN